MQIVCRGLLALAVVGAVAVLLAPGSAAKGVLPPGASYPWVQLPAWVVAAGAPAEVAAVPGSGYSWVQPPAWIPF